MTDQAIDGIIGMIVWFGGFLSFSAFVITLVILLFVVIIGRLSALWDRITDR